jgi:hypothetical protein
VDRAAQPRLARRGRDGQPERDSGVPVGGHERAAQQRPDRGLADRPDRGSIRIAPTSGGPTTLAHIAPLFARRTEGSSRRRPPRIRKEP